MNDLSSLILGIIVFAVGFALGMVGWKRSASSMEASSELGKGEWLSNSHQRMRLILNGLLMIVGLVMSSTAFVVDRRVWASLWLVIGCMLLGILTLALIDASRLIFHYRRTLPRIAQDTLGVKPLSHSRSETSPSSPGSSETNN